MLGACQVGKAWAAVDGQGRFATVAVLDGVAASDQRWRDAFANAVNALAQADGGHTFAASDFSAAHPWVAYTAEQGHAPQRLFQSLGLDYQPVPDLPISAPPVSGTPASATPVSATPVSGPSVSSPPVSGAPELVSEMPQLPWAVQQATPVSGQPVSPSPQPVSGSPSSPDAGTPVPSPRPPVGQTGAAFQDPFATPTRRIKPSEPQRSRTGLRVGLIALVLVLVVGGGVAVWALSGNDDGTPDGAPTASAALPPPIPTTPPQSPGIEPPKAGAWPTQWPRFNERDTVRTLTDLDGLGFPVKVPTTWQCTLVGRTEGFVKYQCGAAATGQQAVGGEVIVRDCPQPCTDQWQNAMRGVEEAWGAQWIRSGQYASYAEQIIEIDGQQRHGLVVVAYFRSGESGAIDRQLVIRMTSPVPEAYQLRRFASYIRDVVVF
ncbi:hypothetical protein ACFOOK_27800 [Micromonospora krabiensis]|nr:hypothetical protein [Micromonospora krabiensis]